MGQFTQQMNAYEHWKKDLKVDITRYRSWLKTNKLGSDQLDHRIEEVLNKLRHDYLTIAFVGEFSRGKTELINALFFSQFGKRVLPSNIGRTTMCTTELYYDQAENKSYIKLLPIETRTSEKSLTDYKQDHSAWVDKPFKEFSADSVSESFREVARTKSVTKREAQRLGFDVTKLSKDPDDQFAYLVPAWRHALISFEHPLLRQGLRILDTPGLNALGVEPELTLKILPSAQAIIFILSADTGVTASDLTIWEKHLRPQSAPNTYALFAVLNKIDMLWDDITPLEGYQDSLAHLQSVTAKQLKLDKKEVLPISARKALSAKIKSDKQLLSQSGIDELEQLISERILTQREQLVAQTVVKSSINMVKASHHSLQTRIDTLKKHRDKEKGQSQEQTLESFTKKTRHDYEAYQTRLMTVKSSNRLIERHGELLLNILNADKLTDYIENTHKKLKSSWTTVGINKVIKEFFEYLDKELDEFESEANRTARVIDSLYTKYCQDYDVELSPPDLPDISVYRTQLAAFNARANSFKAYMVTAFSEQNVVVRRFINTLVLEVRAIHAQAYHDVDTWIKGALAPIMQHTMDHKQILAQQLEELKQMSDMGRNEQAKRRKIERFIQQLTQQQKELEGILYRLKKPSPYSRTQKVVPIRSELSVSA